MAEQYQPNVGQLCHDGARRDCIHFALAPVESDSVLLPGQRIRLSLEGKLIPASNGEYIGIVDPFLDSIVQIGQKCWIMLRPGSVTGMRHVWSSPHFKPKVPYLGES